MKIGDWEYAYFCRDCGVEIRWGQIPCPNCGDPLHIVRIGLKRWLQPSLFWDGLVDWLFGGKWEYR